MNPKYSICIAVATAMLLPACATVTRGTEQNFVIESTPSEADVKLSTGQKCVTPCKLKLKRKHDFVATVTKPGYQPASAEVNSKLSGGGAVAGAGNVIVGGIIGGIVDGSSGALNDLKPNPLQVTLAPLVADVEPGAPEAAPAVAAEAAVAEAPTAGAPNR